MRWDCKKPEVPHRRVGQARSTSTVACGSRLGRAGATSERRKEVSVIAIDVMKGLCDGTIFVRESETKGREGRVESCELDQLHG